MRRPGDFDVFWAVVEIRWFGFVDDLVVLRVCDGAVFAFSPWPPLVGRELISYFCGSEGCPSRPFGVHLGITKAVWATLRGLRFSRLRLVVECLWFQACPARRAA